MEHESAHAQQSAVDLAERVRAIRARLPGQVLAERIDTARACYGSLYTLDQIRQQVADTLPHRVGFLRAASLETIETYRQRIPDDALVKYGDALESGLFSRFWVATPTYWSREQADPWIVAEVTGTELWAIIAQWDVG
jgi:hypothetical protein